MAAKAAESFLCIPITHSMSSRTRLGRRVNTGPLKAVFFPRTL
jgi:hypothetical protein